MGSLDEIQYAIQNEVLYNTYKILDMAEPYGHKPGVLAICTVCGNKKRIRFSNLKNGYTKPCSCLSKNTRREKRDYRTYIGKTYMNWEIADIISCGKNYKTGNAIIKCMKCGYTKEVSAYNFICKMDDNKNVLSCTNCKDISKNKLIKDREELFKNKYIGITYKDDTIVDVICNNMTTLDNCIVKCNICGRTREEQISAFINHYDRHIKICECKASGWIKYSKLVGKKSLTDEILKFEYEKTEHGYKKWFTLKCSKCGKERRISNVSKVAHNIGMSTRPANIGYKMCMCNKGTRADNILDRYKKYIGQRIDGSTLTVLDLELGYNGAGKRIVFANTYCECGTIKKQSLHSILSGHTRSCGCKLLASMGERSLYYSDNFIGKLFDDLEVVGVEQTENGGILWDCKCVICGKQDKINPKLVVERKWHINCGCKEQSPFERNNKYTSVDLINKDMGGGTILEIIRTPGGITKWKMKCKYCGNTYYANASNVSNGSTKSCGCIGKSLGEKMVKHVLTELHVEYREQVKVPDTKSIMGGSLYFDFVIKHNNKIAIIEYDGEQHYDIDSFTFGGTGAKDTQTEMFRRLQENDKIKNEYCETNKYAILRIRDGIYHGKYENIKELIIKLLESL